jgi:hypothetical protein
VEATPKAFLSVHRRLGGELDWGGGWCWPHGAHGCASARCLHGAGLGSWRRDGAARGASKGGGSRGAARGVVTGCLAPTSRWYNGDDSNRSAQQDDVMPQQ